MKTLINLRVFSHLSKGDEHSYYACHNIEGGLSKTMDTIAVDTSSCSFIQLRELIEEHQVDNIMRRRPFFQEFIHFMQRCPNPIKYEGKALSSYRLGIIKIEATKNEIGSVPPSAIKLIKERDEANLICEVVDGPGFEIVLIPRTQIHPSTGRLTAAD